MSDEKVWTVDDTRQMLKEQRAAQVPVVEPAKDMPPVMTVDDVKRMLKGLPPLTEEEKAEQAKPPKVTDVEAQLEAETGKDFTQTGSNPPTYVETDKPASAGVPKGKPK